MQRSNSSVQQGGPRQWFWTRLAEMPELQGTDMLAMIFAAQDAAKRQAYQDALGMFERIVSTAAAERDGSIVLARAALEAADVAHHGKAFDKAEAWYALAVETYDLLDGDEARGELVTALKGHAANTVSLSQQPYLDKRAFVVLCRKAFFLFDRVVALVDPDLRSVNPTLIGPLLSLGQLAANLQRFDLSMMYFERNIKIRKSIGQATESTYAHLQKVEEKMKQVSSNAETQWLHQQRDLQEELQQAEQRARQQIRTAAFRGLFAIEASDKPTVEEYLESLRQQQMRQQQQQQSVREVRPLSAESIQRAFYTTGSFSGMSAQQELEAFRRDVDLGKQAVRNKQLEDAQDYFLAAAEKASQGLLSVVPVEEHRSALGSLAYVFCMRAQNEFEKGSYKFRRMMANSIQHYKKIIEITEERIAEVQADEAEELSLSATYLQLGVVCVNLDRPETGLFFMRKARDVKLRLRRDATSEEKQIQQVEKGVSKRDAELLTSATQLAEARKQTIAADRNVKLQDCVRWLLAGKMLMQQRKCEDAEPLLLQAVVGMEELIRTDPSLRLKPDYRQALTALGASYYFVAQEHGKRTQAFVANSEQALVYYQQVLSLLQDSPGPDDPSCCPILFNVACCYVNLRRYDIATRHFARCRAIKQRNNMPTDDLDSNLEALEAKLLSQIDDDNLFAAQRSSSQQQRAQTSSSTPSGSSTSTPSSTQDPTTPTGSAKELPLSLSIVQSAKLGRKMVSFLMPGEGDSDAGSDVDSTPGSPSKAPTSILVTSTDSKMLTTPLVRRPQATGQELRSPTFERPAELARQDAGDLDALVVNAAKFVAREEIDDRVQLLQLYELLRRSTVMFYFHRAVNQTRLVLQVSLEASSRQILVTGFRKQWLAAAIQLLEEMDAAYRKKLFADYRKVITLPSISHHDKLTSMQEAKARAAIHSSQRLDFFNIIEGANRERVAVWEQKAFQVFFIKALESKAMHVKANMLIVALRTTLASRFKFIADAERIVRLETVTSERLVFLETKRVFALATHRVKETYNRRVIKATQTAAFHPINELGTRLLIEREQRFTFRRELAAPMLEGVILINERAERTQIASYTEVAFCVYFLLPTHSVREEHHRRLISRSWRDQLTSAVRAAFREEEEIARRELQRELLEDLSEQFFLALQQLEGHNRRGLARLREATCVSEARLPMLQELERLSRRAVADEYHRRFDGIIMLSLLRNQEMVSTYEHRSRKIIAMLEDEGVLLLVEKFEEKLRDVITRQWQGITTRMLFTHRKILVVMQETIMRHAGERLMQLNRHERIMKTMAPLTLEIMFRQFAIRKIAGAETSIRRLVSTAGLTGGVQIAIAFAHQETETTLASIRVDQIVDFKGILTDFVEKWEGINRSVVARERLSENRQLWDSMLGHQCVALGATETRLRSTNVLAAEASARLVGLTYMHQRWVVYQDQQQIRTHMILSMRRSFWTNIRRAADRSVVCAQEAEQRRAVALEWRASRSIVMAQGVQLELLCLAVDSHAAKLRLVESTMRHQAVESIRDAELNQMTRERDWSAQRVEVAVDEREARSDILASIAEDMELMLSDMLFDRMVLEQQGLFAAERRVRMKLFATGQLIATRDVMEPFARGLVELAAFEAQRQAMLVRHGFGNVFDEEKIASAKLFQQYALETKAAVLSRQAFADYVAVPYAFVAGMRQLVHEQEEDFEELMRDFLLASSVTSIEVEEKMARREILGCEHWESSALQLECFVEEQQFLILDADDAFAALCDHEARSLIETEASAALETLTDASEKILDRVHFDFRATQMEILWRSAALAAQTEEAVGWRALVEEAVVAEGQFAFLAAAQTVLLQSEGDVRLVVAFAEAEEYGALCARLRFTHAIFSMQIAEHASRRRILANELNSSSVILGDGRAGVSGLKFRAAVADEAAARAEIVVGGRGGLLVSFFEPTKRLLIQNQEGGEAQKLLVRREHLHRRFLQAHEAASVSAAAEHFAVAAHQLLLSGMIGDHLITAEMLLQRRSTVVEEQADFCSVLKAFEGQGSAILLGFREESRRHRLETAEYTEEVLHPLRLAELDIVIHGHSRAAARRCEEAERWGIALLQTADREALQRPLVEQLLMNLLLFSHAETSARLRVAAEHDVTYDSLRHVFTTATFQRTAEQIVVASNKQAAAVHCWSALLQVGVYAQDLVVEHARHFLSLAKMEEAHRREALCEEEVQERRFLWAKEVLDDEKAGRSSLRGLLKLHAVIVESCSTRVALHRSEERELYGIRHAQLTAARLISRCDHELDEIRSRAAVEKIVIYSTFHIFQAHVIMTEFVSRAETVTRVVRVVRQERREFELIKSEFELTKPAPPPPVSVMSPRGRPSFDSDGRFAGPPASRSLSGGSLGGQSGGGHSLKAPLFLQRPRVGSFLLEPIKNAPVAVPAAVADDKSSITAMIARKKVRKQLAALATADECTIREALTVRPMSASSAETTPRDLDNKAGSSLKLAPMNSAVVRFQKSDAADVAQRIAAQHLADGVRHLATHERFARHSLAEAREKETRSLAAEMLLERFEMTAEAEMELTIETLASELMGAVDSFF
jgi:tetratricopeptide (TPR) repeat protein